MDADQAQQFLDEFATSLEKLETQHAALLQFLKDKGIIADDEFAPYLTQAAKTSSVRWRAARIRLDSLLAKAKQQEEKQQADAKQQNEKPAAEQQPQPPAAGQPAPDQAQQPKDKEKPDPTPSQPPPAQAQDKGKESAEPKAKS